MKTVVKVFETILALPISIIIGLVFGAFLFVCSPFYTFAKIFESIWGYYNELSDY